MDDSDDKARRNLVVASAAVLLCWIAGIPLTAIAERLLGLSGPDAHFRLDPRRVIGATLAALIYLLLRFRFSLDTAAAHKEMMDEWRQRTRARVHRTVQRALDRFSRTSRPSHIFNGSLWLVAKTLNDSMAETHWKATGNRLAPTVPTLTAYGLGIDSHGQALADPYQGPMTLSAEWAAPTRMSTSGIGGASYKFTGWRKGLIRAKTLAILALYSRSSLQIFLPSVLASAAVLIEVAQLAVAIAHK